MLHMAGSRQSNAHCPFTIDDPKTKPAGHSALGCGRLIAVFGNLGPSRLRSPLMLGRQLAIIRGLLEPKILAEPLAWPLWHATAMRLPRDKPRSQEERQIETGQ